MAKESPGIERCTAAIKFEVNVVGDEGTELRLGGYNTPIVHIHRNAAHAATSANSASSTPHPPAGGRGAGSMLPASGWPKSDYSSEPRAYSAPSHVRMSSSDFSFVVHSSASGSESFFSVML